MQHQVEGRSISLVAEYQGQVAGYVNVYPGSQWGAFANRGYPEIVDFGVLEPYRRQGVGSKLMDLAEEIAAQYAEVVYLGVGLHRGYGSAQRMYVKRGYLPQTALASGMAMRYVSKMECTAMTTLWRCISPRS